MVEIFHYFRLVFPGIAVLFPGKFVGPYSVHGLGGEKGGYLFLLSHGIL